MDSFKDENPLASSSLLLNNSKSMNINESESWNNLIETTQSINRISGTSTESDDIKIKENSSISKNETSSLRESSLDLDSNEEENENERRKQSGIRNRYKNRISNQKSDSDSDSDSEIENNYKKKSNRKYILSDSDEEEEKQKPSKLHLDSSNYKNTNSNQKNDSDSDSDFEIGNNYKKKSNRKYISSDSDEEDEKQRQSKLHSHSSNYKHSHYNKNKSDSSRNTVTGSSSNDDKQSSPEAPKKQATKNKKLLDSDSFNFTEYRQSTYNNNSSDSEKKEDKFDSSRNTATASSSKDDQESSPESLKKQATKNKKLLDSDSFNFTKYRPSTYNNNSSDSEREEDKSDSFKNTDIDSDSNVEKSIRPKSKIEIISVNSSSSEEPEENIESISFFEASCSNASASIIEMDDNNSSNFLTQEEFRKQYFFQTKEIRNLNNEINNFQLSLKANLNLLPDKGERLKIKFAQKKTELENLLQQNDKLLSSVPKEMLDEYMKPAASSLNNASGYSGNLPTEPAPRGYGARAISTFNSEKVVTYQAIERIHTSLKSRPDESTFNTQPEGLHSSIKLMPHQLHALAWLSWRENQKPKGGILADDMGLGKTLSMLSFILQSVDQNDNENSEDDDSEPIAETQSYIPGGSLIICPASLINQWADEIKTKLKKNVLTFTMHHGTKRETKPKRLSIYDIVLTTYSIVRNENSLTSKSISNGPLNKIRWRRIILDEGHNIRNHTSKSAIAVCGLKAYSRFVLTGTPVHNKEQDLYSLIKFLRCHPFDDFKTWKRWCLAGDKTRLHTVLSSLILQRSKQTLIENKSIDFSAKKTIEEIRVDLDSEEMNIYQQILNLSKTLFSQFLSQQAEKQHGPGFSVKQIEDEQNLNKMDKNLLKLYKKMVEMTNITQTSILVLLLRLRQICCHPSLIRAMLSNDNASCTDDLEALRAGEEDGLDEEIFTQLNRLSINPKKEENEEQTSWHISNPIFDPSRLNSKTRAVLKKIQEIVKNRSDKVVCVSQWVGYLNILENQLKTNSIDSMMLVGNVPIQKRSQMVKEFNSPGGIQVMLLSLTAGGVGLNLIGGNHLFICDLHWNPQLEAQAQDRVYRIGQKKNVFIYKIVCADTIEEKIQALQKNKLEIANEILTGAKKTSSQLTINDLRNLFS